MAYKTSSSVCRYVASVLFFFFFLIICNYMGPPRTGVRRPCITNYLAAQGVEVHALPMLYKLLRRPKPPLPPRFRRPWMTEWGRCRHVFDMVICGILIEAMIVLNKKEDWLSPWISALDLDKCIHNLYKVYIWCNKIWVYLHVFHYAQYYWRNKFTPIHIFCILYLL